MSGLIEEINVECLDVSPGASKLQSSTSSPRKLIEASALSRTYQRGSENVKALRQVSFSIDAGAFAVVAGPSGSGKSTLLNLIGGIDRPSSGSLRVHGEVLDSKSEAELDAFRREYVGFLFQFNNLLPNLSALENVALPLVARGCRWSKALAQAEVELTAIGLSSRKDHRPDELSGGEQQRVALARAIINRPALVLADEPTGDLDEQSAGVVLDLMLEINTTSSTTILLATHNSNLIAHATQVIRLANGRRLGEVDA
ncbi:MAG: ABC transporter ATP-binding protein [Anaerolineales bacterium]|jgi:ABC-type lipoprotein export system ATPase subunit